MIWSSEPPVNLEAERALLGAVFLDNRVYHRIDVPLAGRHFAVGVHGELYDACVRAIEAGRQADHLILREFREHPEIARLGDGEAGQYLAGLLASVVTLINVPGYARVIRDLAMRRALMAIGRDLFEAAARDALVREADTVLAEHEANLSEYVLAEEYGPGAAAGPRRWSDEVEDALAEWQAAHEGTLPPGLPTGIAALDAATGGLFPGDLVLVGARPSMGKTALALTMAVAAAESFRRAGRGSVLFFSLEQPGRQLVTRDAAAAAGVAMPDVRAGKLDFPELKRLMQTAHDRRGLPILLDSRGGLSVGRMATTARRHRRKDAVGLIVVDYLQFIGFDDRYRGNRAYEVAEATRALKALAKELEVPVVLLSQLNRAAETREGRRPQLADLRESGSIEQDADVVLLLYREDYYLARDGEPARRPGDGDDDHQMRLARHRAHAEAVAGLADIVIAKQRNGPCGTVPARFDAAGMRFTDLQPKGD